MEIVLAAFTGALSGQIILFLAARLYRFLLEKFYCPICRKWGEQRLSNDRLWIKCPNCLAEYK